MNDNGQRDERLPLKHLLYFVSSPSSPLQLQEGLDMALAMSAMGQDVSLLFSQQASRVLRAGFDASAQGARDLRKNLKALGLYGINHVYYLNPEGFTTEALTGKAIFFDQIQALINQHDRIISL